LTRRPAPPDGIEHIARGLAHEIRNPLNTMNLTLQLLEEDLEKGRRPADEEIRGEIQRVRQEIQRLERILTDFLRYARSPEAHLEPVDIGHVIADVLDFIEPEAARVGVELQREIEPARTVHADVSLLRQATLNLILNAFQAMPHGGVLRVSVRPEEKGGVELSVSDTGGGIPQDVRARIFEPFFSTKQEGTGLGLAVVQQVADRHGARIAVQSASKGTTFRLVFPPEPPERGPHV
jgi:signal transduction histidine kinase